jgi:YbgC/YbaW family acyl-CoA thioester hydrolase
MAYTRRLPIRFADVDCARVVYFPRFFDYCHGVQEDFFGDEVGAPYAELMGQRHLGFPSVHAEADFKAPFRLGETARIVLEVAKVGRRSATLRFRLYRGDTDELCATVVNVVACIDLRTFAAAELPEDVRGALQRHLGAP